MTNVLSAFALVMLTPASALAVVDSYTECKTLLEFSVKIEQTSYAVPIGSAFTLVHSHAPTEQQIVTQYVAYHGQLLRKAEIATDPGKQTVPMVLVDNLYSFPYPQGANSLAVYDMTARGFHSSADLTRDGSYSVPLNCYPVSGLY